MEPRVFCGGEHTLVVAPGGVLLQLGACGLGFDWAKGTGNYVAKVPVAGPFKAVVAGYYHNILATMGQCFSYGCGRQASNDGQLARSSTDEHTTPLLVPSFAQGFCGGHHSVLLMSNALRACGAGWQAQMGNGRMDYKNPNLQTVQISQALKTQLLGGVYYHNAASGKGRCEVWGCNENAS